MKRKIRNILLILISSVVLGLVLLTLVFCLPVNTAKSHVEESLYNMIDVAKDENGSAWRKKIIGAKDSFTDYLMVQNALERVAGESALAHAVYVYHYDLANEQTWLTEESLVAFLKQGTDGMFLREYSRYWHGYLVWLKPLLMCISWSNAEILLMLCQLVLLLAVVALAFYKKQGGLGVGVIVALAYMKPLGVWFSLTLMTCWTITLFALLAVLLWKDKIIKKDWWEEFFLLVGIMTSYMDFLTYPIVTLGIPLCFYIAQSMDEEVLWWQKLKQFLGMAVCWGIGYIGMWGMKWLVAELTFQTGTLRDAIWSVIFRTEPLDGYASTLSGVSRTLGAVLQQYNSTYYQIGIGIILAVTLISVIVCLIKKPGSNWGITIGSLAVVALFPFIWLILTQNHTAIHCSYTFRIMGIAVMALCSMIACNLKVLKNTAENSEKMENK